MLLADDAGQALPAKRANREEIVRAIFPKAAAAVHGALPVSADRSVSAADVGRYHLAGIETLWQFRFLFRDLDELLSRDPLLSKWYRQVQDRMVGQFGVLFERLIAQRQMRRPSPPEDLRRIATNAFVLWTNWVRYVTSARGTLRVRYTDLAEGALHAFLSFAPYLDRASLRRYVPLSAGGRAARPCDSDRSTLRRSVSAASVPPNAGVAGVPGMLLRSA